MKYLWNIYNYLLKFALICFGILVNIVFPIYMLLKHVLSVTDLSLPYTDVCVPLYTSICEKNITGDSGRN